METAGARVTAFTDSKEKGFLTLDVVVQIGGLDVTERAVGLTAALDVTTSATDAGQRVASWQVVGDMGDVAILTWGRWPGPGEAIVTAAAMNLLAFDYPVGAVTTAIGITYPVVGQYAPRDPFDDFSTAVLVQASDTTSARTVRVLATAAETVPAAKAGALAVIGRPNEDLRIESSADIAQLQVELMSDLDAYGRSLMLLVLAAGALLTAIVVLADVLLHRADLGRRRALGAPRWVIVALVTGRSATAGASGALVGTITTALILTQTGTPPAPEFAAATALLATLAASVAALPPAIAASRRDPIQVLRTP